MSLVAARQSATPYSIVGFDGTDKSEKLLWVLFTVTVTGSYTTGGDTLDLTALVPYGCNNAPLQVSLQSQSPASGHSGYQYYYRPGSAATQSNGKMQVLQSGNNGAMQELSAGSYPAAITGDVIVGQACFVYGN